MIFIKIITPFRHPDLCGAEDEESRADEDADEGRDAGDAKFAEGVDEATGGAGGIPSVEITSSLWVDEAAL
jgi:hypothetical protein